MLADRFRVHRRLGAGGTATVFLAEDCVLCREVAIKRLHTEARKPTFDGFAARHASEPLCHPNLVTIFDTLSGSDGVLIVMEYVRGRPLSDLIAPRESTPGGFSRSFVLSPQPSTTLTSTASSIAT